MELAARHRQLSRHRLWRREIKANSWSFGWFYTTAPNMPSCSRRRFSAKVYTASLDENGAIDAGHRYAADILAQFGGKSLGRHAHRLCVRSHRLERNLGDELGRHAISGKLTNYGSISTFPSASPDGRMVAFTTYAGGYPAIQMFRLIPAANCRSIISAPR